MNLAKLFEMQQNLMNRIEKEHPQKPGEDRFYKRILALLVEVGECANEHRGFKYWSKNQKPRTKKAQNPYIDSEDAVFYNPLLEEYVDGLHFVLELGIVSCIDLDIYHSFEFPEGEWDATHAFLTVFEEIQMFTDLGTYSDLLESYIRLGAALGFVWEEIEQAYFAKNEVNHQRQDNHY